MRDACLHGGQELFLMVKLDNRDLDASDLGVLFYETLLLRRGFTAFFPTGVLGCEWHLGIGWSRLLDVDAKESYQLVAYYLEVSPPTVRQLLALSSEIPSLGALLHLVLPGGTSSELRSVDAWSGLLECGLAPPSGGGCSCRRVSSRWRPRAGSMNGSPEEEGSILSWITSTSRIHFFRDL